MRSRRMNNASNWQIVALVVVGVLGILGVLILTPNETTTARLALISAIVAFIAPTIAGLSAKKEATRVGERLDANHVENRTILEHIEKSVNGKTHE